MLETVEKNRIAFSSVILCQDATMQRRMSAGLRKYRPDVTVVNYASYQTEVIERDGHLSYAEQLHGMWDIDQYITLLMGEIPRLSDDKEGYPS